MNSDLQYIRPNKQRLSNLKFLVIGLLPFLSTNEQKLNNKVKTKYNAIYKPYFIV